MSAAQSAPGLDRFAAWRAGKAEREARYAALEAEEAALAKAEGRAPLPVRGRARLAEIARRRRLMLTARLLAGISKPDIARDEGISVRRLEQILAHGGLAMPSRNGARFIPVMIHGAKAAWLDRFAEKKGMTPSAVAARLLTVLLDEPVKAERMMGKRVRR